VGTPPELAIEVETTAVNEGTWSGVKALY